MGTGEKMAELFISLAVKALFSVGRVVIFDKLTSLRAQIGPAVDELRPIDSLVRQSTPRDNFEGVPGNEAPLLVAPVILGLGEVTVNVGANFGAQSTDIVRGDGLVPVEYLDRHIPGRKRRDGIPDAE